MKKRAILFAGMLGAIVVLNCVSASAAGANRLAANNITWRSTYKDSNSYMNNFLQKGWEKYICANGGTWGCANNTQNQGSSQTPARPPSQTPPQTTETPTETTTFSKPTSQPASDQNQYAVKVVELVNQQRAANGLAPLKMSSDLNNAAQLKSQDMKNKNYFDHTSPTYGTPFQMLKSLGISYKSAGENIAKGQKTPEAVVQAWMNSEGHRKNILNSGYTEIGVGYVQGGGSTYWTQIFVRR